MTPVRGDGFSLVELTVVLVLVGLISAMALPNLATAYRRFEFHSALQQVHLRLAQLPLEVRLSGKPITIADPEDVTTYLEPQKHWHIEVIEPIRISFSGICHGGEVEFHLEDFSERVAVSAPYCDVAEKVSNGI